MLKCCEQSTVVNPRYAIFNLIAKTVPSGKLYHSHFIHEESKIIYDYMLIAPNQEIQFQNQYFSNIRNIHIFYY